MSELKAVSRAWTIEVDRKILESSPLAREYVSQLIDMAVAASVQSLEETREELKKIEAMLMTQFSEYEKQSHGFRRSVVYKGKAEAFERFIEIIALEIETYDKRIAANIENNGQD